MLRRSAPVSMLATFLEVKTLIFIFESTGDVISNLSKFTTLIPAAAVKPWLAELSLKELLASLKA